jgi:hypothetical protein
VPLADKLAWTIEEFCAVHHLSPSTYYELRKVALNPQEMRIGSRVWITRESAAEWRRKRTEATKELEAASA